AASALEHRRDLMLRAEERAGQVRGQRVVPSVERDLSRHAGGAEGPPALLSATSSPPKRSTASRTSAAANPSSRTSPASGMASPPSPVISAASASISAARRAPSTTFAPSRANSFAAGWPMPELAPATIATFLSRADMRGTSFARNTSHASVRRRHPFLALVSGGTPAPHATRSVRRKWRLEVSRLEGVDASSKSTPRCVDAPDTRAVCSDEQKHEAVDHSKLALVHDREERFGAVCHPIGRRHLAAGNEGCPARQQPGRDQGARYQLDRPGAVNDNRRGSGRRRRRDIEQLGEPVTKKEQADDDAHQCVGLGAIGLHELGHIYAPFF